MQWNLHAWLLWYGTRLVQPYIIIAWFCCSTYTYRIVNTVHSQYSAWFHPVFVVITLQFYHFQFTHIHATMISGLHGLIVGGAGGILNILDQVCKQGNKIFQCACITIAWYDWVPLTIEFMLLATEKNNRGWVSIPYIHIHTYTPLDMHESDNYSEMVTTRWMTLLRNIFNY